MPFKIRGNNQSIADEFSSPGLSLPFTPEELLMQMKQGYLPGAAFRQMQMRGMTPPPEPGIGMGGTSGGAGAGGMIMPPSNEGANAAPGQFKEGSENIPYVVRKGDTLWGIAQRFYGDPMKFQGIAQVNSLENPDMIMPGQVIYVPPSPEI